MRKLVASLVSFALFTSMLAGCASMTPNSAWSPRDIAESTHAPSQTPPR